MTLSIAIIGGGLCGATLAHYLRDSAKITVFEKARGVGGRMSCRYADTRSFDHGAPYIIARTNAFKTFLKPLEAEGIITPWNARLTTLSKGEKPYKRDWFEPHYVPVPRMNSLVKHLLAGVDVHVGTRIETIARDDKQWRLTREDRQDAGLFDMVICTAPAPQAHVLMPEECRFKADIEAVGMTGAYSLMIGLDDAPPVLFDMAYVKDSPITKIIINSSKPGRSEGFALMAQTSAIWSEAHIDDNQDAVKALLTTEIEEITGIAVPAEPPYHALHRWRYAATVDAPEIDYFADTDNGLYVSADWCIGGGVEDAFLSGYRLATALTGLVPR